jgi:hypothetical protein
LVTPGKSAEFRSSLWSAIEKSLDCMFVETKKVLTLQKQLASSTTLAPHINEVDAECTKFWDEVSAILGDELARASQSKSLGAGAVIFFYRKKFQRRRFF